MTPVVSRPNEDLDLEIIYHALKHGRYFKPDSTVQSNAFAALARVQARIEGLEEAADTWRRGTEANHARAERLQARQQQLEDALRETFDLAAFVNGEDPWYAKNEGIDVGAIFARARAALAVSGGRGDV